MFKAKHSFKATEPTDIDLHTGDIITNVEYLDNGWAIGFNATRREAGIFPRRFIQPVHVEQQSIFKPAAPSQRPLYGDQRVEDYNNSDDIQSWLQSLNIDALKEAYRHVVHTNRQEFVVVKRFVGFLVGLVLGALTFIGCRYALEYDIFVSAGISGFTAVVLCIGLIFSTKCRAIVTLCMPTFGTKSGRLVIMTIAAAVILSGPILNISKNTTELLGTASCAGEVLKNETKELAEIAKEQLAGMMQGLKKAIAELQALQEKTKQFLEPAAIASKEVKATLAKIRTDVAAARNNCTGGVRNASSACVTNIGRSRTKCIDDLGDDCKSWSRLLNLPDPCSDGSRSNVLCGPLSNSLCQFTDAAKPYCEGLDLGGTIQQAVDAMQAKIEELQNYFLAKVKIDHRLEANATSSKNASEVRAEIKAEMESKTSGIRSFITIASRILSCTVWLVIIKSYLYLRQYLKDDTFDNRYITEEFKIVDKRRREKGKHSLLPLNPQELASVVRITKVTPNNLERKEMCTGFLPSIFNIAGGIAIILADYALFYATALAHRYGDLKFRFSTNIDVDIKVTGDGFFAKLLRPMVDGMRMDEEDQRTIDLSVCLPVGFEPKIDHVIGLAALYLLLLLMVFANAYALRLRHLVAAYYYPEREKARVKYLHRKLLRRRVVRLKELKDVLMVKRKQEERSEVNKDVIDDIKSCVCCCQSKTDDCTICDRPFSENWCEFCGSLFCEDCFEHVIKRKCPCDADVELTYDHVTDTDFEDNEQGEIAQLYSSYHSRDGQEINFNRNSRFERQQSDQSD